MVTQQDAHATTLDLVGKVYEAAADARRWPDFLNAFADATGSEGTVIWLHHLGNGSAQLSDDRQSFVSNVRIDSSWLTRYVEHYTNTNVLVKNIDALPEGGFLVSSSYLPEVEFRNTEYYNDWLRPQGVGYCMGGPVLKRDNTVAVFSASRLLNRGRFGDDDLRLMTLLMPHLRRACLLHQQLSKIDAERSGAVAALELVSAAVWLLDADGRLLFGNRAGHDLDRLRDGLWIGPNGRPIAADPAEQQALQQCINQSIAAGMGLSARSDGALCVRRGRCDAPLHVMVYPLGRDALLRGAAVALFIIDPACTPVTEASALQMLFGLTKAEARLALALAQGTTVQEYGAAHGLSGNTVRTHLKRALEKTGTHRQSQLVGLIARLPATRNVCHR